MKITELIRELLDVIDNVDKSQPDDSVEDKGYSDNDMKRFRQIVDLASEPTNVEYANQPNEQYADIDSVTVDAGADGWQGTKHPADIRGEHPSLYPGKVYGAR